MLVATYGLLINACCLLFVCCGLPVVCSLLCGKLICWLMLLSFARRLFGVVCCVCPVVGCLKLFVCCLSCVVFCLIATWCNAWCTGRRFQDRSGKCHLCSLCGGEDSLEHYATCDYQWEVFAILRAWKVF